MNSLIQTFLILSTAAPLHLQNPTNTYPNLIQRLQTFTEQACNASQAPCKEANFRPLFHEILHQIMQKIDSAKGIHAIEIINKHLFQTLSFSPQKHSAELQWMLLPIVLTQRKGNCLGLASLYLMLAQSLKLPIQSILVPGHLFLRFHEKNVSRNIELLAEGIERSDQFYQEHFDIPTGVSSYLRSLSEDEFIALLHYNLANEFRKTGQYEQARSTYLEVVQGFSRLAPAYANLGLTYHLQGNYIMALQAYKRALLIDHRLPGLGKNVALLILQMNPLLALAQGLYTPFQP